MGKNNEQDCIAKEGRVYGKEQRIGKGQEKRASHEKPASHHFAFPQPARRVVKDERLI
jgi:hypothetical protein